MRELLFHLQPSAQSSLQAQIRERLVSAILGGLLPAEERLPSSRQLAKTLGVSRNTVTLAYQTLVDDGFLIGFERSGYFVNAEMVGNAGAGQRDSAAASSGDHRHRLGRPSEKASGAPAQHREAARLAVVRLPVHLRPGRPHVVPARRMAGMRARSARPPLPRLVDQRYLGQRRPDDRRADPPPHPAATRHHGRRRRDPDHPRRPERALYPDQPAGRRDDEGRHGGAGISRRAQQFRAAGHPTSPWRRSIARGW